MAFISRAGSAQEPAARSSGRPIIGCGAGHRHSAKCAEAGGADLIIIYNSGRYRCRARSRWPACSRMGDATASVVEMAPRCSRRQEDARPAGVCGTDPFRLMPVSSSSSRKWASSGRQNFPTSDWSTATSGPTSKPPGWLRQGVGWFAWRTDGPLTSPYAFTPDEWRAPNGPKPAQTSWWRHVGYHRWYDRRRRGSERDQAIAK